MPAEPRAASGSTIGQVPNVDTPARIAALLAEDRRNLGQFVRYLDEGVGFDEMDKGLREWWLARY